MVMQFPLYLDNKNLAILEVPNKLTRDSYNILKEQLKFYLTIIERINVNDNSSKKLS